jgi:hypothetical protein
VKTAIQVYYISQVSKSLPARAPLLVKLQNSSSRDLKNPYPMNGVFQERDMSLDSAEGTIHKHCTKLSDQCAQ